LITGSGFTSEESDNSKYAFPEVNKSSDDLFPTTTIPPAPRPAPRTESRIKNIFGAKPVLVANDDTPRTPITREDLFPFLDSYSYVSSADGVPPPAPAVTPTATKLPQNPISAKNLLSFNEEGGNDESSYSYSYSNSDKGNKPAPALSSEYSSSQVTQAPQEIPSSSAEGERKIYNSAFDTSDNPNNISNATQ
jgi:hypothetical protein